MKRVCILGSTGSIGTQALDVISRDERLEVTAIAAGSDIIRMEEQIRKFSPKIAAVCDENAAKQLRDNVKDTPVKVLAGPDGVREVAGAGADITVTAMVGSAGILPTLDAIASGSDIALANKETMVCAGDLVKRAAKDKHVRIIPVDSEHCAIFQCIGDKKTDVNRIFLTASGGPFFGRTRRELEEVTVEDALRHPNWNMGAKITVDSATMMNKGLEVLEAVQLFDVKPEDIEVVIHRQSIVHSMVEFRDYSVLAQLGWPDMRLPIAYALSYPEMSIPSANPLDFAERLSLTFEKPDLNTFGCLRLGFRAARAGGTMTTAYSSAGEAAVSLFLDKKCTFLDIEEFVEKTMDAHKPVINPTLSCIIETDRWARANVFALWEGKQK